MNLSIPNRLQIFTEGPVVLTNSDVMRLSPYLGGWPALWDFFKNESPTEEDLKRLVIMELMGDRREQMVGRLLGRLSTVQLERWHARIREVVEIVPAQRRATKGKKK